MSVDLTGVSDEALWAELKRRESRDVVVSWSAKRHYAKPGGRRHHAGEVEAVCSPYTFGLKPGADGRVTWGLGTGRHVLQLPMCKTCDRKAKS